MFGERGYHMHYGMRGNAVLNHPMMDMASGFMLSPMRAGIRLATGAEFARLDSAATPVQLERAEPLARKLLPLGSGCRASRGLECGRACRTWCR